MIGLCLALALADDYKAPSYEKKYDGYFQYANVPSEHEYEFGYNRGNPHHYTSRYEQAKDWRFRTKVSSASPLISTFPFPPDALSVHPSVHPSVHVPTRLLLMNILQGIALCPPVS